MTTPSVAGRSTAATVSPDSPDQDDSHWRDLLVANYPLVERIVSGIAQRYRLSGEDIDELASLVRYRLVEGRYRMLRQYQGRSSLKTYLTAAIQRMWIDYLIARHGKWRPSAAAKRLGASAVLLERMVGRDRVPIDEAIETLSSRSTAPPDRAELGRLRALLPCRRRPRFCALDDAALVAILPPPASDPQEARSEARRRRALGEALARLPETDRHLLTLRFRDGWPVARIAREFHVDQKAMYRRFDRIFKSVRAALPADIRPRIPRRRATRSAAAA